MRKIIVLQICAGMLLMSGCSSTESQEISEIASTTTFTVIDTAENLQSSEQTVASVVTEETAATETTLISSEKYTPTDNEIEQIQTLLKNSRSIFYDYVLGKEMQNHVSWGRYITIPSTDDLGKSFDMPVYEIVDGDVLSIADMQDKMRPYFTDKFIDYIFDECNYYYYEENGKLYVSDGVGSEGGGAGVDTVHITSVGTTDEDTLILYMIKFGAGENWGLDHDLENNFTVTLKRTDNGFKIDECNRAAQASIAWSYVPEDDVF